MPHPALVDEFFDRVIEKVAAGKGISAALEDTGIASATFYRRLKGKPEMAERYTEAVALRKLQKAERYRAKADEIAFTDGHPKQWDAVKTGLEAYSEEHARKTVVEHVGGQTHRVMTVDLTEVAKILAESGVSIPNGSAEKLPRTELLPARPDTEASSVPDRKRRPRRQPAAG